MRQNSLLVCTRAEYLNNIVFVANIESCLIGNRVGKVKSSLTLKRLSEKDFDTLRTVLTTQSDIKSRRNNGNNIK